MKRMAGLVLILCAGCSVLFPESSVAIEKLPVGFWDDATGLLWAIGSDIYGWIEFLVDLAL